MNTTVKYDLEVIKEEARQLIDKGLVDRQQPIYALCKYIPGRDWVCVEVELEKNDFLLRDRIIDLLGREDWDED
ncbi:DUF4327 family protein [Aetokthonos hydrillicola Thurmond2011]|uniref:DUF4327 family protein n=1 Tax=Aetokthonos hydrillicola Thurmond2011 TaxID=2712845 RepID=A0AAP5M392_9CYAN|nr:DUF4327 family protein [Aetokthonos hydrillicola]MBO3459370.1 DUF4327 family protein [Aetokthonos hydrillicola CCALA 1050]MBW4586516.1 DUF4327 family protein [Aetokthonos hydrillicola CCALA 1050]MDR9893541.1 DUF4327 family protein [Aetokthonos hydrillicola Thurmond2011]